MNIPYIITNTSITVVIDSKSYSLTSGHPNYSKVKECIVNRQFDKIASLVDIPTNIVKFSSGKVVVEQGNVKYNNKVIDNYVSQKILQFMQEGLPFEPLAKFLDKLMDNPSRRAVLELYKFLEHKAMPITSNGNFLAYKSVRKDYTDHYSGMFDNSKGKTLEMPRHDVCDDTNIGCSYGFHAGSFEYARSFGSDSRLMIVEINPADVVSIPSDANHQKLRTCKYNVVSECVDYEMLNDSYYEDSVECQKAKQPRDKNGRFIKVIKNN